MKLIKRWINSMKVSKNVQMSSFVVEKENLLEMPSSPSVLEEDLLEMPSSPIVLEEDLLEMPSSPIIKEEDSLEISDEKIQFIIDLNIQFNNLCEIVHDVSLEDKTCIEDNEVIDYMRFLKKMYNLLLT